MWWIYIVFGSSYIFKVKSICVKICISRKLSLNNARHERITIMKIKETCQLLLQPDSKRSLSKIAQNCSILLILDKYQKNVLIWSWTSISVTSLVGFEGADFFLFFKFYWKAKLSRTKQNNVITAHVKVNQKMAFFGSEITENFQIQFRLAPGNWNPGFWKQYF